MEASGDEVTKCEESSLPCGGSGVGKERTAGLPTILLRWEVVLGSSLGLGEVNGSEEKVEG